MSKMFTVLLIIETSRSYGRKLLRGIAQYAHLNGPWVIERQAPFYLQDSHQVDSVLLKNLPKVDGIIMREQKNADELIKSGIPIVFVSYLKHDYPIPSIRSDDENIGQSGAKYFIDRGFENLGYAGYDDMFWSESRKQAFIQTVQSAGLTCRLYTQPKGKARKTWQDEQTQLADWLVSLPKPAAVLACNDDRGQQILSACRLAGLSVPEDIAVLGVDNDEFVCTLTHPPLSSIALNLEIAGFEAASVLDTIMQGQKPPIQEIPVKVSNIVTRQSSDILAIKDKVISEAIQFIREHVREPIQISDVLDKVNISRRSLYDKFKQQLGCSVHQYIKKCRTEYIEHLLLSTDLSISQIALRMGFTDDDHIAQYFRSVKGINPQKFRAARTLKKTL